jgi:U4/U6.U5 tri-snRNP-associated protein 1
MPLDLSLDIASSSANDLKDWVQKNQAKNEKKRKQQQIVQHDDEDDDEQEYGQKQAQKKLKTSEYTSKDLKGLQVMHGVNEFEQGQEIILTLADTSVLDKDEYGRVKGVKEEDDDILENVNITEREKILEREKQLKKLRQPLYAGYDDDEFEEGRLPGMKRSLLSQYDKEKKKSAKLVLLGENEVIFNQSAEDKEMIEQNKHNPIFKRKYESLQSDLKQASSYLAPDEIKFKKSSKDRKKSKIRKQTKDEDEAAQVSKPKSAGDDEDEGYDLKDILGGGDDSNEKESKMAVVKEEPTSNTTSSQPKKTKVKTFDFEDEDPDLSLALAKARQLALQKRIQESKQKDSMEVDDEEEEQEHDADKGAKIARELALQAVKDEERKKQLDAIQGNTDEGLLEIDSEGRRSDGKLIFNSTTEFTSRLQAHLNEHARSKAEEAMRDTIGESSIITGHHKSSHRHTTEEEGSITSSTRMRMDSSNANPKGEDGEESYNWDEVDEEEMSMGTASMTSSQRLAEEDDQLAFIHQQPVVAKGLAATLDLLRSTGELKKQNELAGRAKDERNEYPDDDPKGVKIEYRDEFGRELTKKEAYRQLSYKFHGYGPGKKKLEKRLKVSSSPTPPYCVLIQSLSPYFCRRCKRRRK